jgi:hypothetical protein
MKNTIKILFFFLLAANNLLNANNQITMPLPVFCRPDANVTLPAGTLVLLETSEVKYSDQVTVGTMFNFRVRTNVMAQGEVVISTGSLAVGRIKSIRTNTYNDPEEVTVELFYVQAVDGQMVPLNGNELTIRGQFANEGTKVEYATFMTSQVMNNIVIHI